MQDKHLVAPADNYHLKAENVDLIPLSRMTVKSSLSLRELEAMRSGGSIPASKYGLELICGASCDTGAQ